jgi:lipoprotein NlpI
MTKAKADFSTVNALGPTFAYPTLWRAVLDARTGAPNRAKEMSGRFDAKAWPAPVFRFLAGELTQDELVAAVADPDPWTRRGQVCEANFYGGEPALARGNKEEAMRLFGLARADCPSSFIELEGAQVELARLYRAMAAGAAVAR